MIKFLKAAHLNSRLESARYYLRIQRQKWLGRAQHDVILLRAALISALLAGAIYFSSGLQGGFLYFHYAAHSLPAAFWEYLSFIADTMATLTVVLMVSWRFPHLSLSVLVSAIVGVLLVHGMKSFIGAPRPPSVLPLDMLTVLGPTYYKDSTPSGHTATAFVFVALLTRTIAAPSLKWIVFIPAILVAWSRIACGVHWPVDVALGAAVGLVAAFIGLKVSDRLSLSLVGYLALSSIFGIAALLLVGYDGGFQSIKVSGPILAFGALSLWLGGWYYLLVVGVRKA
jgi:membrane-associated phospholipid phosphatase